MLFIGTTRRLHAQTFDEEAPAFLELQPQFIEDGEILRVIFNLKFEDRANAEPVFGAGDNMYDHAELVVIEWNGQDIYALEHTSLSDLDLGSEFTSSTFTDSRFDSDTFREYIRTSLSDGITSIRRRTAAYDSNQDVVQMEIRISRNIVSKIGVGDVTSNFRLFANYWDRGVSSQGTDFAGAHLSAEYTVSSPEEDDNYTDELEFSVQEGAGFNLITFNVAKVAGERDSDNLACLNLYSRNGDGVWTNIFKIRDTDSEFNDCTALSNADGNGDFSASGNTYRYYTSPASDIVGSGSTSQSDGDEVLQVIHYYDPDAFGNTIFYSLEGDYFLRDIDGNQRVDVGNNNRADVQTIHSGFSIPQIDINDVTAGTTSCEITLSWDEPTDFGNPISRNKILVYKDNETPIVLDAQDNTQNTSYTDTNPQRDVTHAYQIANAYDRPKNGMLIGQTSPAQTETIPILEAPVGLGSSQTGCDGTITVTWNWSLPSPAAFVLQRRQDGTNFETIADNIGSSLRNFDDTNIEENTVYYYRIAAIDNLCGFLGRFSDVHTSSQDDVDLSTTIARDGLETSKGYFADRTELFWNPTGDNEEFINRYRIYARILGTDVVPTLLETVGRDARSFFHDRGEAGELYEYFVISERVVETICGVQTTQSYPIEAITDLTNLPEDLPATGVAYEVGLRSPSAVVNGSITFAGGTAVSDVRVQVDREGDPLGQSLYLNGSAFVRVPHSPSLAVDTALTMSAWIKPEDLTRGVVVLQKRGSYGLEIGTDGRAFMFVRDDVDETAHIVSVPSEDLQVNQWVNLTCTYSANSGELNLYINGVNTGSPTIVPAGRRNINFSTQDFIIGMQDLNYFYQGNIDEVRVYNRALSAEDVRREFGRTTVSDAPGLVGYWRIFEGLGDNIFDISRVGSSFYKNDGVLNGVIWSEDFPTTTQLGTAGFTNEDGNYTIEGIEYRGNGNNFTITPTITLDGVIHEFDPGSRVVFLGEGNPVENGLDFTDVSSFAVTGVAKYRFQNDDVPIAGANLLIDGVVVTNNEGGLVLTDADGSFTLDVPIGEHNISIRLPNHEFENDGVWPGPGQLFDFQAGVSGIEFFSSSTKRIIGRVVGGTEEGEKILGLGRSVNNIGQASFNLVSTDGLVNVPVTTDMVTGEYFADVPPVAYNFIHPLTNQPGIQIINNGAISFSPDRLELLQFDNLADRFVIDTIRDASGEILQIDSALFHAQRNFVFRSDPEINVVDASATFAGEPLLGEREFIFTNNNNEEVTIPLVSGTNTTLNYPVFRQFTDYQMRISITEEYTNFDNNQVFSSPVQDAELVITNNIGVGSYFENGEQLFYRSPGETQEVIQMDQIDGDTVYTFTPISPNFNAVASAPENSYTNTLNITAITGGNVVEWDGNDNGVFRAYTFGSVQSGETNFITRSPDIVSFILRDPPGSNSYSFMEEGTEITNVVSQSLSTGGGIDFNARIGPAFSISAGAFVSVTVEVFAQVTAGFNFRRNVTENNEISTTLTTTTRFQTNEDNITVGAQGDLYVGESQAYRYGISQNLQLVETNVCGTDGSSGVACLNNAITVQGSDQNTYTLGNRLGYFLDPEGSPTTFVFTQDQIENVLIPDLAGLRNTVLNSNPDYSSNIPATDSRYGSNNDDPAWGSAATSDDPFGTDGAGRDFDGPSYTWNVRDGQLDSIRYYNQQIRLWEDAIAQNEAEKLRVRSQGDPAASFAITGGSPVSSEQSSTTVTTVENTWELDYEWSAGLNIGISGTEQSFETDLMGVITHNNTNTVSTSNGETRTTGYVLDDGDINDQHLVEVYNGEGNNGPVFFLSSGQTMCPHEPEEVTKYFNPGEVISAGTLQRERPGLSVDNSAVFNVPADEAAVFNLTLENLGETQDDQFYSLFVSDQSNPDGLGFSINGEFFDGEREFLVPGGSAITQTLIVERGPFEFDYEDIQIIMRSTCQFDPTDNDPDIADTVSVEVHYIPVCTEVRLAAPTDNWVANFGNENEVSVVIDEFNINEPGFEFIELQFRPSENSVWQTVERFYRDSNDPDDELIPRDNPVITYQWNVADLPDGNYDLRTITSCQVASLGSDVTESSAIASGLIDRQNPQLFGAPQPADGILSADDEILIQFNEPINSGLLTPSNFSMRGILNGSAIRNEAAVSFNGVNDYMEIPAGINLTRKDFTIEFNVRREGNGAAVLISQGVNTDNGLEIGLTVDDLLYFTLAGETFTSSAPLRDDSRWHHLAFTFDYERTDATIYIDGVADQVNNDFVADYTDTGIIRVGYDGSANYFSGFIHELRIWNRTLELSEVNEVAVRRQARTTPGLMANWEMEEADGVVAFEKVRLLNAAVNADWQVFPRGNSLAFDGTGFAETSGPAITAEQSFSLSFWINTTTTTFSTIMSTGRGDDQDPNVNGWSFNINTQGQIEAHNNNQVFLLSETSVNDGNWHHIALTVNRLANVTGYLDGKEGNSTASTEYRGFSGSKLWLGSRGYFEGIIQENDQLFAGNLDEVRIWLTNRSFTQVNNDRFNKLNGDEEALLFYFPMEENQEVGGIFISQESGENQTDGDNGAALVFTGATAFSDLSPNIRLPRPVEKVNFSYSANGDRIILTPTEDNGRIENTTLNIAVQGIQDLNGNTLQSPITWTAFVDRNQVNWSDDLIRLRKSLGEAITFETNIVNTGGAASDFSIDNLPEWLTASPASGNIGPLSSQIITFTVNAGLNIGDYDQDIYLNTSLGFNERLELALEVYQKPPVDWNVRAEDYQFSMGVVAQVRFGNVFSRDEDVLVAAFVDEEIRGVANLEYVETFDNFQAFLSIYSNTTSGEEVNFRVWNATEGRVHTNISPNIEFQSDSRIGTPDAPQVLEVPDFIRARTEVTEGWQWISFFLRSDQQQNVNEFLGDFKAQDGDILRGQTVFDQYDASTGWFGSLSSAGGLSVSEGYRLKTSQNISFDYEGEIPNPADNPVNLMPGWNWIGFVSQRNMNVNEALSAYNPAVGDEVKSQFEFSVYAGPQNGWVGSLETMVPGRSYLLNSSTGGEFVYPRVSVLNGRSEKQYSDKSDLYQSYGLRPQAYPDNMSLIARTPLTGELMAMQDNELIGVSKPQYNPVSGTETYFMSIYGPVANKSIDFYLQLPSGKRIPLIAEMDIYFKAEAQIGEVSKPVAFYEKELSINQEEIPATVYPNPFEDRLMISGSFKEPTSLSVTLYSLTGQKVMNVISAKKVESVFKINLEEEEPSIGKIKPGVYLLEIKEGNTSRNFRVIKN